MPYARRTRRRHRRRLGRRRLRASRSVRGSASSRRYDRYTRWRPALRTVSMAAKMFGGVKGYGVGKVLDSFDSTGGSPIRALARVQSLRVQRRVRRMLRASRAFRQKVMQSYFAPRRLRFRETGGINGTNPNKRFWHSSLILGSKELTKIREACVAENASAGAGVPIFVHKKLKLLSYREDLNLINTQGTRIDVWYYVVRPRGRTLSTTDADYTNKASPAAVMNDAATRDLGLQPDQWSGSSAVAVGDPSFSPYQSRQFRKLYEIVKSVKFSLMPGSEQKVIWEAPKTYTFDPMLYPNDTVTTGSNTYPGVTHFHLFGFMGQHIFNGAAGKSNEVGSCIPRLNYVREWQATGVPSIVEAPTDEMFGGGYDTITAADACTQVDTSSTLVNLDAATSTDKQTKAGVGLKLSM